MKKKAIITSLAVAMLGLCHQSATAQNNEFITYEQFGAVGDGVHDDMDAIVAAHAVANERNLPVRATDGKTYYIGNIARTAIIKTNVDFGKAKFVINDVDLDNIHKNIFVIEPSTRPYQLTGVKPLTRGQKNLGVKLPTRSLLEVVDDSHNIYIREGLNQNNGTAQKEVFVADEDGNIEERSGIVWNYKQISRLTVYPIDKTQLTVKGGIFTTIANQCPSKYTYHGRGIQINRSNVRIENVTHYVTGELDHGAPYSAFFNVDHVADVVISNCLLTPHKTYGTIGSAGKPVNMGSYDLGGNAAVNIVYEHIRQTISIDDHAYWGIYGSNFCKNLTFDDCHVSRFDAHMGVENVTLTNCIFGYMGVRSVGFGTMLIENCEIRDHCIVSLREDYGSSWEGEMIIRNCKLKAMYPDRDRLVLLSGSNTGRHDFGYLCYLPEKITIDGLEIDDSAIKAKGYNGPDIFGTFNRDAQATDLKPYVLKGKVTMKNVTVKSRKPFHLSANPGIFKDYVVEGVTLK